MTPHRGPVACDVAGIVSPSCCYRLLYTGHHSSPSARGQRSSMRQPARHNTWVAMCVGARISGTADVSCQCPHASTKQGMAASVPVRIEEDWACEQRSNLSGTQGSKGARNEIAGFHPPLNHTPNTAPQSSRSWRGRALSAAHVIFLRAIALSPGMGESTGGFASPLSALRGWVRTSFFRETMPGQHQPKQPAFCPFEDGHKVRGWL
jgi:hypothetical protein